MKKIIISILLLGLVVVAWWAWRSFLAPVTGFAGDSKTIIIPSNATHRNAVEALLLKDSITQRPRALGWLAGQMKYWDKVKPGRYRIEKRMSNKAIVQMLRSGNQWPVRLTLNRLRLQEDLARQVRRVIEADSATVWQVLHHPDSLASVGLDSTNWSAYIIPDTYEVLYTWSPMKVLQKLIADREKWWDKDDRRSKAQSKGLTEEQVHIMASIVEEETNKAEDRPLVASVYLNRIARGMPLQADPTVRFARRDFKSNRVLYGHLRQPSPYNTYLNRGLPPGPICTPSVASLEAVLNAPATNYIFFVAKADLRGGSTFTTNLADHSRAAREYQDSLTAWLKRKAARENAKMDTAVAAPAK